MPEELATFRNIESQLSYASPRVVPEDGDIPRCLNQGVPLCDDNYYAARAFYNIARRIAGYKIPLMKI